MRSKNTRLILLAAGLLGLAYFAAGYAIEIGSALKKLAAEQKALRNIDDLNIDGSDFSWFGTILAGAASGVNKSFTTAVAGVYLVTATIVALGIGAVVRFAAYRNRQWIEPEECKTALYIFGGTGLLSLFVSLIATGGCGALFTVAVHAFPFGAFFALVMLYLIKLSQSEPEMQDFTQMQ
jgi:hypothetical protein